MTAPEAKNPELRESTPTRARSVSGLYAIALAGGAGTMSVELAAVRVLSPWYGTSLVVWTNVLEVILLGLAIGYLAGARLAGSPRPLRSLALSLAVGAVFTACIPSLAAPVCEAFLPSGLPLHEAASLLLWGSLAAALILFLPPAIVLGTVGPLATEEVQRRTGRSAGEAGGRVLAASTLGSVVGAFATSHFALPFGLQATLLGCAAILASASAATWLLVRAGSGARTGAGPLAILLSAFGISAGTSRYDLPELPEGVSILESAESVYQSVRVVQDKRFGTQLRQLQVNEGFDSFQSVWQPNLGLLGEGFYYDDFVLPIWWSSFENQLEGRSAPTPWRVLCLGFGAGTVWRVLSGAKPPGVELQMDGVEIDTEITRLGRKWFDLPTDTTRLRIISGLDARFATRQLEGPYEQIVLDAYTNQVEIPLHLATVEYLEQLEQRLIPGGWLCANVGGFGMDDPVVVALAETMATAFEQSVLVTRVPSARNYSVFARRDRAPIGPADPAWQFGGDVAAQLLQARSMPGAWKWIEPTQVAHVLRDGSNGLDRLQQESMRTGRERLMHGSSGD